MVETFNLSDCKILPFDQSLLSFSLLECILQPKPQVVLFVKVKKVNVRTSKRVGVVGYQ
jgi:hypothetical protein